jgi:hypothetical protein
MDFRTKKHVLKFDSETLKSFRNNVAEGDQLVLVLSKDGELKIREWPGKEAMAWCERIVLLVEEQIPADFGKVKYVIDLASASDIHSPDVGMGSELVRILLPGGDLQLSEDHVEELGDFYVNAIEEKYSKDNACLHLSILDGLSCYIAIRMQEKQWKVFTRTMNENFKFSVIEAQRRLLLDTYKFFFPFSKKVFWSVV